ncbi:unnamed protein product, partial [Brassica oleracea var. botrytis]
SSSSSVYDRYRRNLHPKPPTLLHHVPNHLPNRSSSSATGNLKSAPKPQLSDLLLLRQQRRIIHHPRLQRRLLPHRPPPLPRLLPQRRPLHRPPPSHPLRLPHVPVPRLTRSMRHPGPPDPRGSHHRVSERLDACCQSMVASYAGGEAERVIPTWLWPLWVSWAIVVGSAITVSIRWIWNLWIEWFRVRRGKKCVVHYIVSSVYNVV